MAQCRCDPDLQLTRSHVGRASHGVTVAPSHVMQMSTGPTHEPTQGLVD